MRVCPGCSSIYAAEIDFCGIDGERLTIVPDGAPDPLIGRSVDRYKIIERLGSGAMGCVYKARHDVLDNEYAIKIMFGEYASNQTFAARFRREAQAASKIRHPNIVAVIDFLATANGLSFLVMELIEGRRLDEVIASEAPLSIDRAANILRQIASGLDEAHKLGFVHRDLKPANVMLGVMDAGGHELAKILDFGLVRPAEDDDSGRLTKTGAVLGSPAYMSPEQIDRAEVGPSADLYSLGVVLYELLAGRPPFPAQTVREVLTKHLVHQPDPLPSSGGLETIAMRLLEKEPSKRPTCAEVVAMIDRLFPHISALAPQPAALRTSGRFVRSSSGPLLTPVPMPSATPLPRPPPVVAARSLEATNPSGTLAPLLEINATGVDVLEAADLPARPLKSGSLQRIGLTVGVLAAGIAIGLILRTPPDRAAAPGPVAPAVTVPGAVAPAVTEPGAVAPAVTGPGAVAPAAIEPSALVPAAPVTAPAAPSAPGPSAETAPAAEAPAPREEPRPSARGAGPVQRPAPRARASSASPESPAATLGDLKRRLERVNTKLVALAGKVAADRYRPFERRYLDLEVRCRPGLSADELQRLAREIGRLDKDISALRK